MQPIALVGPVAGACRTVQGRAERVEQRAILREVARHIDAPAGEGESSRRQLQRHVVRTIADRRCDIGREGRTVADRRKVAAHAARSVQDVVLAADAVRAAIDLHRERAGQLALPVTCNWS